MKKAALSAVAAVITAAAVFGIFKLKEPPVRVAAATVYFTSGNSISRVVRTDISRCTSSLRQGATDIDLLDKVAAEAGAGFTGKELRSRITVTRMGDTGGAEIILSGDDIRSHAPIILNLLLKELTSRSGDSENGFPKFTVISYCDMIAEPSFPIAQLAVSVGTVLGLVIYLAAAERSGRTSRRERYIATRDVPEAGSSEDEHLTLEAVCLSRLEKLGTVTSAASLGLEKSGHKALAENVLRAMGDKKILAVSLADPSVIAEGTTAGKLVSYLACAVSADRKHRVLLIECDLHSPSLGGIFKREIRYGMSDIAARNCKVWDAVITNARSGVDLIAEKKSYPCPAAIFSSGAFRQSLACFAMQYDLILLLAPAAWTAEECEIIYREADGVMLCRTADKLSYEAVRGMSSTSARIIGCCNVEKETLPETEKKEGSPDDTQTKKKPKADPAKKQNK